MPPFAAFDIAVVIPGMKVRADSLETGSLGGSESAGVYMARALTAAGARVIVFSNTDDEWRDAAGLRYASVREWPLFANTVPHDVSIVQRSPELFSQQLNSRLNLLWCHDLALGRHAHSFRAALWNIDRCIVVSEYMARQYKEVYGLSDEVLLVSRNGVDLALIDAIRAEGHPRDPDKLMYCARPERGLDVLLKDVMPALLAANPKLRLFIAGYDNHPHEWQEF